MRRKWISENKICGRFSNFAQANNRHFYHTDFEYIKYKYFKQSCSGIRIYERKITTYPMLEGGVIIDEKCQHLKMPYRTRYCEYLGKMRLKTLKE